LQPWVQAVEHDEAVVHEAAVHEACGDGGSSGADDEKPGYLRQEMEGIGGVVKKKVKKVVRVGKTVKEFEDEREGGEYLWREMKGERRSWCRWCNRVVLGKADLEMQRMAAASSGLERV
jgi:hypothetical protein